MQYVLITLSGGLIDEVRFFPEPVQAVQALSRFVQTMDTEAEEGALYSAHGLVANAKDFLDEEEAYQDNSQEVLGRVEELPGAIWIIANPLHPLGFMTTGPDDPLGYREPAQAVQDLAILRQDKGPHLKLYQVLPVNGPVVARTEFASIQEDELENWDEECVSEYIFQKQGGEKHDRT